MKLTLQERFALIDILPQQGNMVLMSRARKLRDRLLPTEAEDEEFGIAHDGPAIRCNKKGRSVEREIDIGEAMTEEIVAKLEKLDKNGQLTIAHVPLYEQFVTAAKPAAGKPDDKSATPPT